MNNFEKIVTACEFTLLKGERYTLDQDSDLVAEKRADDVAASGLWEKHAQPGFEESAKKIARIAQVDLLHKEALAEDYWRDYRIDLDKEERIIQEEFLYDKDYDYDDDREEDEDPLEGDVDKWVHPDETRTDDQIAFDEKYRTEPY